MEPINHHKAIQLLREVVEGNEFFVYQEPEVHGMRQGCKYFWDGQPSCLVGKALSLGGANDGVLEEINDGIPGHAGDASANLLFDALPVSGAAASVFSAAQDVQDRGVVWREALAHAEDEYAKQCAAEVAE